MYDKIYGGLLGAAAGDAMGAATETRTRKQVEELFGGYVTDFYAPPMDTFARGNKAGQVTDDFSVAYMTLKEVVAQGKLDDEVAKTALFKWADTPAFFDRFAGPTTRASIAAMRGETPAANVFVPVNENRRATNGAAMKTAPIALLSGGDVEKAIADCITVCKLTHNNNIALSGAAAIAAATATAMQKDATLFDVIQASIYGAHKGDEIGREIGDTLAGASVEARIKWAVNIAMQAEDLSHAIDDLSDYIGSGLMTVEAVPAAIGLCVAAKGNTVDGICAGVNIGDDTDTVTTMIGGILGALNGVDSIPQHYIDVLDEANGFHLDRLAQEMVNLIK